MFDLHLSQLNLFAADVSAAEGYQLGTGRLVPTVALVVGLAGVVAGVLAARSARRAAPGNGRTGALVALVAGLLSGVVGGLHAANAAGGLGTGNGLAGAVLAVALGVVGMVVGGWVLARSRTARRTASRTA